MVKKAPVEDILLRDIPPDKVEAITSLSKRIRVIAAPGTGKTETLTRRVAWLLLRKRVPPDRIVAFTFTEKAAENMKERVYDRVTELGERTLVNQIGRMFLGTIHSFCAYLLRDDPDYGHYDVLDDNEEIAFLLKHGHSFGITAKGRYSEGKNYAEKCLNFHRNADVIYNDLLDIKKVGAAGPPYDKFAEDFRQYEELLDQEHLLTFGRLIPLAVKCLEEKPRLLTDIGFEHLLVDEFQDINPTQHKLINLIGRHASVFIVGDPRQTIYQWRGSDCSCFDRFASKPALHDVELKENRRSTKRVIDVANAFTKGADWAAGQKPMLGLRKDAGSAFVLKAETPEEEAEYIIERIKTARRKGIPYGQMAILFRSVRTSAPPFVRLLRNEGIPFTVHGRVGLFRRREIQTLAALFAWLINDGSWWRAETEDSNVINLYGDDLLDFALKTWTDFGKTLGVNFRLKRAKPALARVKSALADVKIRESPYPNVTSLYHELLNILGFKKFDADSPEGTQAVAMANLGRFSTVLTDFQGPYRRRGANPTWQSFLKNLNWYMLTYAYEAYDERISEDEKPLDAVVLSTVHQAKGLEWQLVFVPALQARRFPSSMTGIKQFWTIPEDLFDLRRYEGNIDDEARLFFVAITRAADHLILSCFERKKIKSAPSPFLVALESELEPLSKRPGVEPLPHRRDYKEFTTISVSDIIRYRRCPYWFRLNVLWGFQPALSRFLGYGKDLHYILRRLGEEVKKGSDPLTLVDKFVQRYFMLPYMAKELSDEFGAKAAAKIKNYIRNHEEEMGAIEEVEARIEFPLGGDTEIKATVKGVIDVLLAKSGSEIRDYKTSEESTTIEDARAQLLLYAAGIRGLGREVNRASVAYIDENDVKEWKINDDDIDSELERTATDIESMIIKKDFHPRPDHKKKYCLDCDYAVICRAVTVSRS
jgi:DNA helicase-2/ATP-dependent DNA helicase PcrA